jgi:DNA invertase Pin-like site-specific DNA recombinase
MEGRFVSYLRVSTKKQGLGLEAQRAAVAAYLNGGGWQLIAEFVEKESGTKHENRVELAKAKALCKKRKATLVIAKLDRLARNVHFVSGLQEGKIKFVCCDNPHANELTINILAAVAQQEAKDISIRTKAALAALKAQGRKLGGPDPATSAALGRAVRTAKADEFAAKMRPMIEAIRGRGVTTLQGIADELTRQRWTTPTGGDTWTPNTVAKVMARWDRIASSSK